MSGDESTFLVVLDGDGAIARCSRLAVVSSCVPDAGFIHDEYISAQLHQLIDNSDAFFYRLDASLKPILMAGSPERLSGFTITEYSENPNSFWQALHPDDRGYVTDSFSNMIETRKRLTIDFRIRGKDGHTKWVRAFLRPYYNESGELLYIDGFDVGIDSEKLVEEQARRHTELITALATAAHAFSASRSAEQTAEIATSNVSRMLGSTSCLFSFMSESPGCIANAAPDAGGVSVDPHNDACAMLSVDSFFGKTGIGPKRTNDFGSLSPQLREIADMFGIGPAVISPIYASGVVTHILITMRKKGEEAFTDEDLWFVAEIAAHSSSSITNIMLYEKQTRIAKTFERSLIPDPPRIEGFDISTYYSSAEQGLDVGGDFFDILDFGEGKIGVVVGDVSGKGLVSAVLTGQAKHMLRAFAFEKQEPGELITSLNKALCVFLEYYSFVALFYGLIDSRAGTLTYVSAGQELPIVLHAANGGTDTLSCTGPVLGMLNDQDYDANTIPFGCGDLLFCYTDGITDIPSRDDWFGFERLADAVRKSGAATSNELIQHIVREIEAFCVKGRTDDQLMVVIGCPDKSRQ